MGSGDAKDPVSRKLASDVRAEMPDRARFIFEDVHDDAKGHRIYFLYLQGLMKQNQ